MTKEQLLAYGHEIITDAFISPSRKNTEPFDIPLHVVIETRHDKQNSFILLRGSQQKTIQATKLIKNMTINEAHLFYEKTTTKEMKLMVLLEGD